MSIAPIPDAGQARCPACGAPATAADRPFCGQGCRDRDLLRWLSEGHRLPGPPLDEDAEEAGTDGLDSGAGPP